MSTTPKPSEWDANAYRQLSDPQFRWGVQVLDTLHLRGDETVLDAGCGAGRVTAELLERLPRGRVLAVDLSRNMVEQARALLEPRFGERVHVFERDLLALDLNEAVEGIFSTAVFHWIGDHDKLFRGLFAALRPGGWLVAQCGGGLNLKRLRQRGRRIMRTPSFAGLFANWSEPWEYASAEKTAERLERAGFVQIKTDLVEAPTTLPDRETYKKFLAAVTMRHHLLYVPDEALREEFLDRLADLATKDSPPFTLDYWRLNMRAAKKS
ncbi:MAG TPA: class I SAM-dependent methyltransferase [Terriglobales bacterium]|nr:class I SAM-dependent methyltransferase [Terriglobales bacterium]